MRNTSWGAWKGLCRKGTDSKRRQEQVLCLGGNFFHVGPTRVQANQSSSLQLSVYIQITMAGKPVSKPTRRIKWENAQRVPIIACRQLIDGPMLRGVTATARVACPRTNMPFKVLVFISHFYGAPRVPTFNKYTFSILFGLHQSLRGARSELFES